MYNKKPKKVKILKDDKTRIEEVRNINKQFSDLGLPDDHEGVQEFISITKAFEKDGIASSGKIQLVGFQRTLKYKYSIQPHIASIIVLEYTPYV